MPCQNNLTSNYSKQFQAIKTHTSARNRKHRTLWGVEPSPETGILTRLTTEESAFYDQLRLNDLGSQIRLEQEKIGFKWLVEALGALGRV
ncbi:MAG: Wadjet anti-phage system protein JetD domain-containing protein [Chlorobium sp.]